MDVPPLLSFKVGAHEVRVEPADRDHLEIEISFTGKARQENLCQSIADKLETIFRTRLERADISVEEARTNSTDRWLERTLPIAYAYSDGNDDNCMEAMGTVFLEVKKGLRIRKDRVELENIDKLHERAASGEFDTTETDFTKIRGRYDVEEDSATDQRPFAQQVKDIVEDVCRYHSERPLIPKTVILHLAQQLPIQLVQHSVSQESSSVDEQLADIVRRVYTNLPEAYFTRFNLPQETKKSAIKYYKEVAADDVVAALVEGLSPLFSEWQARVATTQEISIPKRTPPTETAVTSYVKPEPIRLSTSNMEIAVRKGLYEAALHEEALKELAPLIAQSIHVTNSNVNGKPPAGHAGHCWVNNFKNNHGAESAEISLTDLQFRAAIRQAVIDKEVDKESIDRIEEQVMAAIGQHKKSTEASRKGAG